MKKRNFDTGIWKKRWFRMLPSALKNFWYFFHSECDDAGVWSVDLERAEFCIGERIEENEALNIADNLGDKQFEAITKYKWRSRDFIKFHYPGGLDDGNNFHRSVINLLKLHDLFDPGLSRARDYTGSNKNKTKSKTCTKKSTKENTKESTKKKLLEFAPEAIALRDLWNKHRSEQYGLGVDDSKTATLKWIARRLKEHTPEILRRCIDWRFEQLEIEGTEGKYIGKVTNFFGEAALFENYLNDNWQPPKPKRQVE